MHLSGFSYRPALLSVDCPLVSGGLSRGSGSQGTSGRGRLPAGVASAHLPRTRKPSDVLSQVGGDVPELSAAGRRALRQVEPLSGSPCGLLWDAQAPVHSRGGPPRTTPPCTPVSWS